MGMPWGWGQLEGEEECRRGPWTAAEDKLLIEHVTLHGEGRWNSVATSAGLKRNGKSCRLRWVNYLRPDLKKGQITPHEESIIIELHAQWGNRWSTIARSLPGRTDNEIKNYWRTHFKKKGKASRGSEKQKDKILKQHQQQHHHQFPINTSINHVEEGENKISQSSTKPEMVWIYPTTTEEQFFQSMFMVETMLPETSYEEFVWDDLWNMG